MAGAERVFALLDTKPDVQDVPEARPLLAVLAAAGRAAIRRAVSIPKNHSHGTPFASMTYTFGHGPTFHDFDIGLGTELKLDYAAKDHKGFDHLIPTVIRGSRAVPFRDWLVAAPHRSQIKRKCQRIADSA
jgi:hypothetical protein